MSFTENPFVHMGVITHDSGDTYRWECDGCGGQGGDFDRYSLVDDIRKDFISHIHMSHGRKKADFKGWS